ncbi:MAG: CRTAC1 family protein [Planctomycetes bacterium]|nr:CRTAC1 family protein [Planctomycetota bacterium]
MQRVRSVLFVAMADAFAFASIALAQVFVDVTSGSGLEGAPRDDSLYPDGVYGVGMCALDHDGDGDVDVFVAGGVFNGSQHRLYRNDGNMQFTDVTAQAGFGPNLGVRAAQSADIDNDGDDDLLLCNWRRRLQLYINDGTGHFVESAMAWGLTGQTSAWGATFGDFDRDGLLDLYLANRLNANASPQPSILYRNLGDRFVRVFDGEPVTAPDAATLFAVFIDFDEDGWPDLYTVNDKGTSYAPNQLFRNHAGQWFEPVGETFDAVDAMYGMGCDFVDAFCDGGVDFFVSDRAPDHLFRVWSPERGRFRDETQTFGVAGGHLGWAVHFRDFDNDGWFDLHVVHQFAPNHLYRNPAQPAAAEIPWPLVANPISPVEMQLCAIAADFDDDGRIDLLHRFTDLPFLAASRSLALHRNVSPQRHWIGIETRGTTSNRQGYGARIELRAGNDWQRQWRRHGVGYLGTNDRRVHFGLGDRTTVDELRITWPSGVVQHLRDVTADRVLTVVEPSMRLVGDPAIGSACVVELSSPSEGGRSYAVMLASQDSPRTILADGRSLPIRVDYLTALSLTPGNALLHGNVAALHRGAGGGLLTLPAAPALRGMRFYATGVTFDTDGIGTVFGDPVEITIQ